MDEKKPFSTEQKEFLEGFLSGIKGRENVAGTGGAPTAVAKEVHGTPVDELCREELIKLDEHPFDIWERMGLNAQAEKFPEGPDIFRYIFHGLFYVAPGQEALMLRCRIPGGLL